MIFECVKKTSKAFTLIELLLAIVLSSMLIAGLSELYLSVKEVYMQQVALARLQDDGRVASVLLTRAIHQTGYSGCIDNRLDDAIVGYNKNNAPSYLRKRKIVSDVIVITAANDDITRLTRSINEHAKRIYVDQNPATKSQRKLLLSSCQHSEKLYSSNYSGKSVRLKAPIKHSYSMADSEVARIDKVAYFVSKTTRVAVDGSPIYALYSVTNRGNKRELVDDVNGMSIKYGVDSNGDGKVDSYFAASGVRNWDRALSIAIVLSLHTVGTFSKQWHIYIALKER